MISTKLDLENAALHYGLLPFFSNNIPGFSVEEMAEPGVLFGGNDGEDGCWEWKGPVIQEMTTAYGKFFRRKAGFVSLDLYPDFINYRRAAYPIAPGSVEMMLLDIIRENESATSADLRKIIPGKRQALEPPLQKLQMAGRLLIADFQYKYTRLGDRYGWGVALYTTPELWFGESVLNEVNRTPDQSFQKLVSHLHTKLPDATIPAIVKLLS